MNPSAEIVKYYSNTVSVLENELIPLRRKRSFFGWVRLLSILGAISAVWYAVISSLLPLVLAAIILFALFLFVLARDIENDKNIKNKETLIRLAQEEIQSLQGDYSFRENGAKLKASIHGYAEDLDILGPASLFQYLNRTESESGLGQLAQWLLNPAPEEIVLARQASVQELQDSREWMSQLQAYGRLNPISQNTENRVTRWLTEPLLFLPNKYWFVLSRLLPAIAIGTAIAYIVGTIPSTIFYLSVFIFFTGAMAISRKLMPAYIQLQKITDELNTLSNSIRHIESLDPKTAYLASLKSGFVTEGETASRATQRLRKIMDRLDYRLNPLVFIPLNTFFFWDLHQVLALEEWKEKHKESCRQWFTKLAEWEALVSIAVLRFNQPDWVFPELTREEGIFESTELGHPLIPSAKRVTSSFEIQGRAQIALITGSNMAGKSTFLRSVGINTVLAMAGAPVCARKLRISPLRVISSMRISDNLEESTSTFYAELKKLKAIIEAVNRDEKVLVLLDEILRGTNSADRHAGSEALIKQLIRHKATALLATHDLALASLATEFPQQIKNYHFDVQIAGEELFFDYKLKTGICQSMNAVVLMKKIGVEI